MKKNILFMFIGMFIATVTIVVADNISASSIDYKETNVESALDTLYTTQNTTVANLTSANSTLTSTNETLTQEKAELQSQLSAISTAARTFTITTASTPQTVTLGFKPDYIACIADQINNGIVDIVYNKDFNSTKVIRIGSTTVNNNVTSGGHTRDVAFSDLSNWFTLNDNGVTWNITNSYWVGKTIYCFASK